ncbi:MAG: acyltransferase family protein [Oceanicaulis sp.]
MAVKLEWIQVLRAIAAALVLIAHLSQHEDRFLSSQVIPLWVSAGVSGVDLFFVLSGFVMVYVTRHAAHGLTPFIGRFLYARVTRIYPAYWLATLATLAGYLAFAGMLQRDFGELNFVTSFLLWPDSHPPIVPVGWTLIHEMYFYLVFAAMLLAPRRFLPFLLAGWLLLVVLAQPYAASPLTLVITHPLTAEFILGCVVGLLVTSGRRRFAAPVIAAGLIWWVAVTASISWTGHESMPAGWMRVLAYGAPCALLVYGVACLDIDGRRRAPAPLVLAGDWSYALYLVHLPIIAALVRVWGRLFPDGGAVSALGFWIVGAAVCFASAASMHHLFEKPMLGLTRKAGDRIIPAARPIADTPREATKIW